MENLKTIDLSHNELVILNLKEFDFTNTGKIKIENTNTFDRDVPSFSPCLRLY